MFVLLASARSLPEARSDRVGLYGVSAGGWAALMMASTGREVEAVVTEAGRHILDESLDGAPSTHSVVKDLQAPVLVLQGTADTTQLPSTQRDYERDARYFGKTVQVVYFEGIDHRIYASPVWPEASGRAIDFYKKHLLYR